MRQTRHLQEEFKTTTVVSGHKITEHLPYQPDVSTLYASTEYILLALLRVIYKCGHFGKQLPVSEI